MRRGVWFLVLGVLMAALGAASAYAAGSTTTSTTTTSTTSTTTATTTSATTTGTTATTTTAPPTTFSRLVPSYLSKGCVGGGAAAIAEPGRKVLVFAAGEPGLGPSEYPTKAPIIRFLSSTITGSSCTTAHVTLGSVALFGGVLTARSVDATHGRGTVSGLEIYGSPVALRAGRVMRIGGWGEVTLGKTVGRLTAPLVVQLLAAHHSLPAGTTIAFAFGASTRAVHASTRSQTPASKAQGLRKSPSKTKKLRRQQSAKPPPDFPTSASPFTKSGGFTNAARANPVISIAMRYLGIRYQWGGARPRTGFDCSGLVKYVFAQLGVPLIHYAAAQWHSPGGVWVPPNRLRAGDLVFFTGSDGTRKEPGHVGIYVEDGYFIDAPHTGSFVRVDSLTERKFANEYVGARRIMGASLNRDLLHVTKPDASAKDFLLDLPSPLRTEALGNAADIANIVPASAHVAAWKTDVPLLVGGPLSGLLALAVVAGAFAFRRRRTAADSSS
jgi:cell wall-associated NlpC family hydrolase